MRPNCAINICFRLLTAGWYKIAKGKILSLVVLFSVSRLWLDKCCKILCRMLCESVTPSRPWTQPVALLIDCTSYGRINAQIEYKYHAVFVLHKTGTRLHRFSRTAQATNWMNLRKNIFVKTNFISTFFRERNLDVKNLNWCVIWTIERRFFPVVKSASDGLVKFALFSCYLVSWVSPASSVPLRIPLSRISRN